jgi:ribosomal protein S18 acetylase RimI-like enzyme
MTLAIRRAASPDILDMVAVVNLAFEDQQDILAGERTSNVEVRRLMEDSAFFVAVEDQAMVGVVQVQANGTSGYIGMMAVNPQLRRAGIGRALRIAAEDYCRKLGCSEVTLTTASIRPALIEYYCRSGFKIIGVEAQPEDLEFKRKFDFVRMAKAL